MIEPATETDLQLLSRYTRDCTEDAFAELVRRHVDLVHSAALRQVRALQLAEEIAQTVFADLARNATPALLPTQSSPRGFIKSRAAPPLMSSAAKPAASCANKSPPR